MCVTMHETVDTIEACYSSLVCFLAPIILLRNDIWIEQLFCDNFISYTHIVFLLTLSIALVFVSILIFLCIFWLSHKLWTKMVIQITLLYVVSVVMSNLHRYLYSGFSLLILCWVMLNISSLASPKKKIFGLSSINRSLLRPCNLFPSK